MSRSLDSATAPEQVNGAAPRSADRRLVAAAAGGLMLAAGLGLAVRSHVTPFDTWLHDFAVRHRGTDLDVVRTLTQGGSTRIVWPMVILAALIFPRSRGWRRWVTTAAFGGAAALAIGVRLEGSLAFARARPPAADWAGTAGGFAYPSGHTSAATIGAGALGLALVRHLHHRWARAAVWTLAVGYAVVVGWTRMWLGVHWPLDVVGGWLFGAGWICAMAAVASWVETSADP